MTKSLRELRPPFKNNNQLNNDGVTGKMAGEGRSAMKPVVRRHDDNGDDISAIALVTKNNYQGNNDYLIRTTMTKMMTTMTTTMTTATTTTTPTTQQSISEREREDDDGDGTRRPSPLSLTSNRQLNC